MPDLFTPDLADTGFAFVLLCLLFVITSVVAVAVGKIEEVGNDHC